MDEVGVVGVGALDRLYAGYPKDMARPADATVRLFAARPWRRWLRPSVHIGGDFIVPDALPLPLVKQLLPLALPPMLLLMITTSAQARNDTTRSIDAPMRAAPQSETPGRCSCLLCIRR